eukprot:3523514-Pyramimonas_sp.AAC.1
MLAPVWAVLLLGLLVRPDNQSQEGMRYTFEEWEPIAGGDAVYTRSGNQSQEGMRYIRGAGTNRRRGCGVYEERE